MIKTIIFEGVEYTVEQFKVIIQLAEEAADEAKKLVETLKSKL